MVFDADSQCLHINTPDMRQSKTLILSTNADQKSLETEFSIAICRPTCDKWQSKTLFLACFDRVRRLLRAFSIATYPKRKFLTIPAMVASEFQDKQNDSKIYGKLHLGIKISCECPAKLFIFAKNKKKIARSFRICFYGLFMKNYQIP